MLVLTVASFLVRLGWILTYSWSKLLLFPVVFCLTPGNPCHGTLKDRTSLESYEKTQRRNTFNATSQQHMQEKTGKDHFSKNHSPFSDFCREYLYWTFTELPDPMFSNQCSNVADWSSVTKTTRGMQGRPFGQNPNSCKMSHSTKNLQLNMLTLNTNVQMASLVPKYICHYQVSPATPRQSDEDFLSYCFQMSFINSNQFSTLSYLHKNRYCGCLANIKSFSVMIKNYSEVIRKQYIQTNIHTVPCKG